MASVDDLIASATELLLGASQVGWKEEAVDQYVALFDGWRHQAGELSDQSHFTPDHIAKLTVLEQLHAQIIAGVSEMQRDLRTNMIELRKRGEGLLRYADGLPKRLSITRGRRG